jgi:hypothetical protein
MSTYNTKNYTEQGGDVTHIGGKLVIESGAVVEGLDAASFEQAEAVADAASGADAAALRTTLNSLLASLRAAGILASE